MRPTLIALYAPVMQSGKTEVAKVLREDLGYKHLKFAQPVKDMVETYLKTWGPPQEIVEEMLEGDLKERPLPALGKSARQLLQTLGTDWGRDTVHPDIWTLSLEQSLKLALDRGQNVVIDDMRFPNERELILKYGGHCVKILRPGAPSYTSHQSEGMLDNYAMPTLVNGGSLADLKATALTLPAQLEGRY